MPTRVYLLDGGTLQFDMSYITWNQGQGIDYRFPVYSILVVTGDEKVLIDTGFDREWVERVMPFTEPEQTEEQTIVGQLATIGLRPDEIDTVVNTHLHFDHCGGNRFFPGARFVMSKADLRHAYVPDPWERMEYDTNLVEMPGGRFDLLEIDAYDYEVAPGVTLIETPGHSRGHYSVVILPTGATPMVFPIDVAFNRNNLINKVLPGLHTDPIALLASMVKIENIAHKIGGQIFYAHDSDAFKEYKKAPDFYGE